MRRQAFLDRVAFPQEVFSTAGTYLPAQRRLSIPWGYGHRNWGYMDTSSVWGSNGPWWSYSAADDFGFTLTVSLQLDIYFNEVRRIQLP
jgi:hypothetical protein